REQPGNIRDRIGRDAEQASGHVHGFDQFAVQRHVHAVVIARRKVNRREHAVAILFGGARIGEQLGHRVCAALGLQDAAVPDAADLTDAPIGGRQDRVAVAVGVACVLAQRAGKERIETRIRERVRLRGFRHVDAVRAYHATDQEVLPWPPGPARGGAHDAAECFLRNEILEEGRGTHRQKYREEVGSFAACEEARSKVGGCAAFKGQSLKGEVGGFAACKGKERGKIPGSTFYVLPFTLHSLPMPRSGRLASSPMTSELTTIIDLIRYAASRFNAAGLTFGHSHDNAIDEATHLVLSSVHLPPDLPPAYGNARLTAEEKVGVLALLERRIQTREPVAYLVGEAWFAGMPFKSDKRALVPRSPIAELIEDGFSPWLDGREVERALDLCTGSGCIGIAMAAHNPRWRVDIADISDDALALARENIALHQLDGHVRAVRSDLFGGLHGERYDLIVSNPPYVTDAEYAALPGEYAHEPKLGLTAGADGLDLALRI